MICQHLAVLNLRFLVAVHSLAPVMGLPDMDFEFDKPIGTRIANDGTRTPLQYGELKLRTDGSGLYHVIPRTGP